jgi:hypothetical protein
MKKGYYETPCSPASYSAAGAAYSNSRSGAGRL